MHRGDAPHATETETSFISLRSAMLNSAIKLLARVSGLCEGLPSDGSGTRRRESHPERRTQSGELIPSPPCRSFLRSTEPSSSTPTPMSREAEQRMRSCLERLATPTCRKAQQTLEKIAGLWSGRDGTKSMPGVRILPTPEAVRCVAKLVRHQPPPFGPPSSPRSRLHARRRRGGLRRDRARSPR